MLKNEYLSELGGFSWCRQPRPPPWWRPLHCAGSPPMLPSLRKFVCHFISLSKSNNHETFQCSKKKKRREIQPVDEEIVASSRSVNVRENFKFSRKKTKQKTHLLEWRWLRRMIWRLRLSLSWRVVWGVREQGGGSCTGPPAQTSPPPPATPAPPPSPPSTAPPAASHSVSVLASLMAQELLSCCTM